MSLVHVEQEGWREDKNGGKVVDAYVWMKNP
jgi:hypothetical protein